LLIFHGLPWEFRSLTNQSQYLHDEKPDHYPVSWFNAVGLQKGEISG
jgi:hypothetical protein